MRVNYGYMKRVLTLLLLSLSMLSIADGGMLRPCQCDSGDVPACGFCPLSPAMGSADGATLAQCCSPSGDEYGGEEDGCSICPGPREPRDGPGAAVTLAPQTFNLLYTLEMAVPSGGLRLASPWRPAPARERPWRIAPEGLAVFLI